MSDSVWPHRRQSTRLLHPWYSPGKNTGVGWHFLLQRMKVKVKSLSRVRLFAIPWTAAYQAPPTMGYSRQEYWSGLPLPSPINMCRSGLFYFITVWYSVIMNTSQFRYPFCGWRTFTFLFPLLGTIMNNDAVNILVHIIWWTHAHIFVWFTVSTCLTLLDSSEVFSKVVPICLTISSECVFCLFTYSPKLNIVSPFVFIHASGCTAESYWICMSLRNIDILL